MCIRDRAKVVDMEPGELIWAGGDVHLYLNHLEQAQEQVSRAPFAFPTLHLARQPGSIDDFRIEDFEVRDYRSHERIEAPVAV